MIILKHPVALGTSSIVLKREIPDVEVGYAITTDEYNIILNKLGINAKGDITMQGIGYYSNISTLIRGLLSKQLILEGSVLTDLQSIEDKMEEFAQKICKTLEHTNDAK